MISWAEAHKAMKRAVRRVRMYIFDEWSGCCCCGEEWVEFGMRGIAGVDGSFNAGLQD